MSKKSVAVVPKSCRVSTSTEAGSYGQKLVTG